MRRIEHLINDVKFNTNEQSQRFSNMRFNKLFNDAQQEIIRVIHTSNSDSKFFSKYDFQDLVSNKKIYDLPINIYTESSINEVHLDVNNTETYSKLKYNQEYRIANGKLELLFEPRTSTKLRTNFTSKLNTLATRVGQIKTLSATDIKLTGFDPKEDMSEFDDYFCIVDRDGNIIDSEMVIESYSKANGKLITSSTITAPVGSFVVPGRLATTNSELPDACEKYMTMFVERAVHTINSSQGDLNASTIFTAEEKSGIEELFAKNESDVKYPEIVDYDFLDYNERYY